MGVVKNTKANLRAFGNAWNHIGDAIDLLETVKPMTKEVEATIQALEKSAREVRVHMENMNLEEECDMERE